MIKDYQQSFILINFYFLTNPVLWWATKFGWAEQVYTFKNLANCYKQFLVNGGQLITIFTMMVSIKILCKVVIFSYERIDYRFSNRGNKSDKIIQKLKTFTAKIIRATCYALFQFMFFMIVMACFTSCQSQLSRDI